MDRGGTKGRIMRSLAGALGGCRSRLALVALAISFFLSLPTPAQAQLNENCVISILNRTAQVQPDGSWRVTDVPVAVGQCNRSGVGR